eukprot:3608862-Amphidinium_carterae.1
MCRAVFVNKQVKAFLWSSWKPSQGNGKCLHMDWLLMRTWAVAMCCIPLGSVTRCTCKHAV